MVPQRQILHLPALEPWACRLTVLCLHSPCEKWGCRSSSASEGRREVCRTLCTHQAGSVWHVESGQGTLAIKIFRQLRNFPTWRESPFFPHPHANNPRLQFGDWSPRAPSQPDSSWATFSKSPLQALFWVAYFYLPLCFSSGP